MNKLALLIIPALWLAACDANQNLDDPNKVYSENATKFPLGARKSYIDEQLGAPRYYELNPNGRRACAIYAETADNGDKIVHEMRFESDVLVGQLVGPDYGLAACDASV